MGHRDVEGVQVGDGGQSMRFAYARAFQHAFGQAFAFQGAAREIGMEAVEGFLVVVHRHHIVAAFEQAVAKFRADAPATDDDEIHGAYSFLRFLS
ncbi:MAG: hypothetical protein M5U11_01165 [Anaerolineales bacterium]|nr:hypothetical protein [Anaerolineales bacterium]